MPGVLNAQSRLLPGRAAVAAADCSRAGDAGATVCDRTPGVWEDPPTGPSGQSRLPGSHPSRRHRHRRVGRSHRPVLVDAVRWVAREQGKTGGRMRRGAATSAISISVIAPSEQPLYLARSSTPVPAHSWLVAHLAAGLMTNQGSGLIVTITEPIHKRLKAEPDAGHEFWHLGTTQPADGRRSSADAAQPALPLSACCPGS